MKSFCIAVTALFLTLPTAAFAEEGHNIDLSEAGLSLGRVHRKVVQKAVDAKQSPTKIVTGIGAVSATADANGIITSFYFQFKVVDKEIKDPEQEGSTLYCEGGMKRNDGGNWAMDGWGCEV